MFTASTAHGFQVFIKLASFVTLETEEALI